MAEQTIPLIADSFYTLDVTLDDNLCRLTIRWNATDQAWYMNFEQLTEGYELNGIKLILGCVLLEPYATPELGLLFLIDTEGKNRNPDFENFGDLFKLIYIPRADL